MSMAPQASSAPRQQAGTRRSLRLQNQPPDFYVETSSTRPDISQPARTKRKGQPENSESEAKADDPENVRLPNQSQRLFPTIYRLSEHNLRIFNGEEMDFPATIVSALERTSSQRSTAISSEMETVQSQRFCYTISHYRYEHLAAANIYINADPPDDIQIAIDRIVKAEISENHRGKIREIAKGLYDACREKVQAAAGEDNFVDIIKTTLQAIGPHNIFLMIKDRWREDLKPITLQSCLDLSFLTNLNAVGRDQEQEVDDPSTILSRKRQHQSTAQTYISPQSSMADASSPARDNRLPQSNPMLPPPAPAPAFRPVPKKATEISPIKTPHPNISIGTEKTGLISALSFALSLQNINNTETKLFLEQLGKTMILNEQGGPAEPLLIIMPMESESGLVFPFAVVEGKAYSTDKPIFEAQNQAAVSGASGLKIQLSLDKLVKRLHPEGPPIPSKNEPPLFFSICTEGPYHELWAHYTLMEDGMRKFKMKLLKICNGVLLEGVEDFIVAVDNVLRWGTGPFLESVVDRLADVAREAGVRSIRGGWR